jgi:SprT-like protein
LEVDDRELQSLVEEISLEFFEKPFLHRAYFNARLRTTGGRYLLGNHHIEVNKKYFDQLGKEELVGIIKHELCHYHLHLEGKGYKHVDKEFKDLLQKVGGPRHCSTLPESSERKTRKLLLYICEGCQQEYKRRRKIDTKKYVCGKCRGKLILDKVLTFS